MTATFADVARAAVEDLLRLDPVLATALGDHRGDDRLPDRTEGATRDAVVALDDHLTALDAVDDVALPVEEQVDLEILRARLTAARFDLAEIRRRHWDPLSWNPATAVHLLVAREFAPPEERLRSIIGRLHDVPRFLADGRATLREMSRLHVETAVSQLGGFGALLATAHALADDSPGPLRAAFGDAAEAAQAEVDRHVSWLVERLPESRWDPRLGVRLYSAALWHNLDEELTPVEVLEQAERRLDEVGELMREEAARFLGGSAREPDIVRRALARIAAESPVDDSSVLPVVRDALARTTRFVRDHDLVSLPEVDTRVIEMPEFHRGIAVAYCDAPGPLETADVATFVAVAPTPAGWDAGRVTSFYREYNAVLLHDLTIHEAMPGHVLQLAHARAASHPSLVRRFGSSGVFAEGWAVYAEEVMAGRGYAPDDRPDAAQRLRLQQLKMQARMALNAILDARVHGGDIDEPEALALLTRRGFQEEGEAVGKWRRALLTATQLPTCFVGWRGVRGIAADLRVLHPDWSDREIHDLMLSQGTVGPRHLRALLGV
ncbi:MAG: DUF885 domain-containing protein [bacterium]